jgi:RIO kinase 1
MTVKELFDFITDPTVTDSNRDVYLDKMSERAAARTLEEVSAQEQIDEEVFKKAFIPKRLTEVYNIIMNMNINPYFQYIPFHCVK